MCGCLARTRYGLSVTQYLPSTIHTFPYDIYINLVLFDLLCHSAIQFIWVSVLELVYILCNTELLSNTITDIRHYRSLCINRYTVNSDHDKRSPILSVFVCRSIHRGFRSRHTVGRVDLVFGCNEIYADTEYSPLLPFYLPLLSLNFLKMSWSSSIYIYI
jgi:hypothetical protein